MDVCVEPISQATLSYTNYSQLLTPEYQPTLFKYLYEKPWSHIRIVPALIWVELAVTALVGMLSYHESVMLAPMSKQIMCRLAFTAFTVLSFPNHYEYNDHRNRFSICQLVTAVLKITCV